MPRLYRPGPHQEACTATTILASSPGCGLILIDHGNGTWVEYVHVAPTAAGDVKAGQQIGSALPPITGGSWSPDPSAHCGTMFSDTQHVHFAFLKADAGSTKSAHYVSMTQPRLCGRTVDAKGDIVGLGVTNGPDFAVPTSCFPTTAPPAPAPGVSAPPSRPPPTLAGTWVAPTIGAQVKTTKVTLSAKPTASISDVAITKVVYSVAWSGKPAVKGCTATKASSNGSWSCSTDLDKIGAPAGDLTLSFDVFDDAGDVGRSPDGTRRISFAPTPQPRVSTKATMVGPSGDCLTVTAAIDDASRYHLAASCDGRIRYSEFQANGWKTITFQAPSGRLEIGPQLAFDGNTLYLAYTRVAPDQGCGGAYDDIGVYYRTRSGEGGAWSDAVRIGGRKDELFSLRVSDGVINVTVLRGSDSTAQFETVKGTVFHRYPISDANGFVSLRLASNGARVVYESSRGIEFGSFNGQAFTRSLIAKQDGYMFGPILVLDSANHAHVVWTHAPPPGGCAEPEASPKDGTYYATNQSGSWKVERLTRVVGNTSLQVDPSGKVYVLVAGLSLQEFTRSTSGTWSGETVAKVLADSPVLRRDPSTGRSLVAFIHHVDSAKRSGVYVIVRP